MVVWSFSYTHVCIYIVIVIVIVIHKQTYKFNSIIDEPHASLGEYQKKNMYDCLEFIRIGLRVHMYPYAYVETNEENINKLCGRNNPKQFSNKNRKISWENFKWMIILIIIYIVYSLLLELKRFWIIENFENNFFSEYLNNIILGETRCVCQQR